MLGELAVTASHSRPRVSKDNAFSEVQFKTLKYQPDYPQRFDDYDHAMRWCEDYVNWYNNDHHHSALAGFTPQQVFIGEYVEAAKVRQAALDDAYIKHPRNVLAKDIPRYKCRLTKFTSTQYRKMPTSKPLRKESTSQPIRGSLISKLIIKELAQMRLTCSVMVKHQFINCVAHSSRTHRVFNSGKKNTTKNKTRRQKLSPK